MTNWLFGSLRGYRPAFLPRDIVEGRPDDGNRNFAAVGAGSIVAGLTGSFAVDASPPGTAIVRESGGRSQIASLTAVGLMVLLATLAAGLTAYLPHAALSAVLVYIALRIFRLGEMIRIYRRGGPEILLVIACAVLVVALPIETGMLLAIVLSFLHSLYVVAQPRFEELGRVPGTTVWWPPGRANPGEHQPGVIVFDYLEPIAPDLPRAEFMKVLEERIETATNGLLASGV